MVEAGKKLEDLLLEHGLLKLDQLEFVQKRVREQQRTIEEVIRSEQLVYPEPLAQLKAASVGVPYVDLQAVNIDREAMTGVAERAAQTYKFIAFGIDQNRLQVAMAAPDDYQALEAVRFIAKKKGLNLEIYCASPENIEQMFSPGARSKIDDALRDFGQELKQTSKVPQTIERLQQSLEEAPVNKIFAVIMRHAIEGMASDVHIEPFGNEVRIRYRINGQLHTSLLFPINMHRAVVSRVKILASMQVNTSNIPQESRFNFATDQQAYSVRVAILPTIYGEKITLHLVDTSKAAPSFRELGLAGSALTLLKEELKDAKGLVIVAGPDGSGKSTTVNAILTNLNSPATSIASVEETIEYETPGVTQTQISPALDVTYERILQNLLRQDVEIIMVEEIRSKKTAHLLTKGALAGRLMVSTIHAHSAVNTIPQLVDIGVSPYVLSSSLRVLIGQRLVPKLCQSCKKAVVISRKIKNEMQESLRGIDHKQLREYGVSTKLSFYQSTGCANCHERQTDGQVAIFEVVPVTKELAGAIASGANYDTLVNIVREMKCLTLQQDGLLKALQGLVRYEDVVRVTS